MNLENIILALIAGLPALVASIAILIKQVKTNRLVNSHLTDLTKLLTDTRAELLEVTRINATNKATLAEKAAENLRKGDAAIEAMKP